MEERGGGEASIDERKSWRGLGFEKSAGGEARQSVGIGLVGRMHGAKPRANGAARTDPFSPQRNKHLRESQVERSVNHVTSSWRSTRTVHTM
jgi:hypothetical protein